MASLIQPPFTVSTLHPKLLKLSKSPNPLYRLALPRVQSFRLLCTNASPWEPSPPTYAAPREENFLKGPTNLFETLSSDDTTETPVISAEEKETTTQPSTQFQFLKWPMWVLGPALLLATGMVPTLWLPLSSIFLGPNIASLLSLIGLDCIFNLGTTLFLLMADSCAGPKASTRSIKSEAPFSYRFWNMVATISGFVVPLAVLFGSRNGVLQPHLPSISFAVLLGPYLLLLWVQMLTEMLTWHWKSPVWLVTPVVYEAYRVLQLMRGLKLGAELSVPVWMVHTIRGLVCWWVLILGVQLMRVAWFAGFTARSRTEAQPQL